MMAFSTFLLGFLLSLTQKQTKGYARYLVESAMEYAKTEKVPLLFDTDMAQYAQIYRHYGCELYNQTTASNGITRYNLVWEPKH